MNLKIVLLCTTVAIQSASAFVVAPSSVTSAKRNSVDSSSSSALQLSSAASSAGLEKVLDRVREGVVEAGHEEEWNKSCALLVETLGLDEVDAMHYLAQATNWKSWAVTTSNIARKFIKPKTPDTEKLKSNLEWLMAEPLSLDADFVQKGVSLSPVAYLMDSSEIYKKALDTAPSKYSDAESFRTLLLKDPTALQNTYNCADTGCNSECGNCWVSYEMRL